MTGRTLEVDEILRCAQDDRKARATETDSHSEEDDRPMKNLALFVVSEMAKNKNE